MRYYDSRVRYVDFALRHNDGFGDLIAKIKEKALSIIGDIKNAPGIWRKIAVVLAKIVKLCSAVVAGYGAGQLAGTGILKIVSALKGEQKLLSDLTLRALPAGNVYALPNPDNDIGRPVPVESSIFSGPKGMMIKAGLKVVIGLITAVAATAAEQAAKA